MPAKQMTSITQVHLYIKEHFKPGDIVSIGNISPGLLHLTASSISAALWKLGIEEVLILASEGEGPYGCNEYMVNDTYMESRGFEDREAPEPGLPRKRKSKLEKIND